MEDDCLRAMDGDDRKKWTAQMCKTGDMIQLNNQFIQVAFYYKWLSV